MPPTFLEQLLDAPMTSMFAYLVALNQFFLKNEPLIRDISRCQTGYYRHLLHRILGRLTEIFKPADIEALHGLLDTLAQALPTLFSEQDAQGNNGLHAIFKLKIAMTEHQLSCRFFNLLLCHLVDEFIEMLNQRNADNDLPIHVAAQNEKLGALEWLVLNPNCSHLYELVAEQLIDRHNNQRATVLHLLLRDNELARDGLPALLERIIFIVQSKAQDFYKRKTRTNETVFDLIFKPALYHTASSVESKEEVIYSIPSGPQYAVIRTIPEEQLRYYMLRPGRCHKTPISHLLDSIANNIVIFNASAPQYALLAILLEHGIRIYNASEVIQQIVDVLTQDVNAPAALAMYCLALLCRQVENFQYMDFCFQQAGQLGYRQGCFIAPHYYDHDLLLALQRLDEVPACSQFKESAQLLAEMFRNEQVGDVHRESSDQHTLFGKRRAEQPLPPLAAPPASKAFRSS